MKYILLFSFILFLINPVFSQNNKWTFGIMAAPDVCFALPLKQPDFQEIPKM